MSYTFGRVFSLLPTPVDDAVPKMIWLQRRIYSAELVCAFMWLIFSQPYYKYFVIANPYITSMFLGIRLMGGLNSKNVLRNSEVFDKDEEDIWWYPKTHFS